MNRVTATFFGRIAMVGALALLASACLGGGDDGGGAAEGGAAGDGTVEIFGAFSGGEEEAFNASLEAFAEESGIEVEYVPSTDFTTLITSRVEGDNPPDIALFPQPGLLLDLADGGSLVPLNDTIDLAAIEGTLIPGFLEASSLGDQVYGAPMRMAVKSIVWYPTPEFDEAGYAPPETYQGLTELADQIAADGAAPWCLGIESGPDTGWVATDWMEELMLRIHGPEVYDQWVSHEIPFDSPEVVEAAEVFGDIVLSEELVLGGPQGVVTTSFGDSPSPMFEDEPGCYLHRQGNFITGFFPEDVQEDLPANVGNFILPGYEGGFEGTPILGGGDLAAAFNADEDTVQVLEFITSDAFGGPWAEAGGWLSPHSTFDSALYSDEITQGIAELAAGADVFRFDGSDLMPGQVGTGSFWQQMTAWINGDTSLEEALAAIEESWPEEGAAAQDAATEEAS